MVEFGSITYSAHGHNKKSEGRVGTEVVVVITKNKNHTLTNSGIYSVVVRGQKLPMEYRDIDEARLAGQRAYEQSPAIGD